MTNSAEWRKHLSMVHLAGNKPQLVPFTYTVTSLLLKTPCELFSVHACSWNIMGKSILQRSLSTFVTWISKSKAWLYINVHSQPGNGRYALCFCKFMARYIGRVYPPRLLNHATYTRHDFCPLRLLCTASITRYAYYVVLRVCVTAFIQRCSYALLPVPSAVS